MRAIAQTREKRRKRVRFLNFALLSNARRWNVFIRRESSQNSLSKIERKDQGGAHTAENRSVAFLRHIDFCFVFLLWKLSTYVNVRWGGYFRKRSLYFELRWPAFAKANWWIFAKENEAKIARRSIFASFSLAKIHQFALAEAGHLNSKYSMSASGNTPPRIWDFRSHSST